MTLEDVSSKFSALSKVILMWVAVQSLVKEGRITEDQAPSHLLHLMTVANEEDDV